MQGTATSLNQRSSLEFTTCKVCPGFSFLDILMITWFKHLWMVFVSANFSVLKWEHVERKII